MTTKKDLVKQIEKLSNRISKLEACHQKEDYIWVFDDTDYYYKHEPICAYTKKAGIVTFGDIAGLIIDGEPILRDKTVKEEIKPNCCVKQNDDQS